MIAENLLAEWEREIGIGMEEEVADENESVDGSNKKGDGKDAGQGDAAPKGRTLGGDSLKKTSGDRNHIAKR